jgi:phi LC3 family holin
MKINFQVRKNNPVFIAQVILSVLLPILGYMGLNLSDLTSWVLLKDVLLQAIVNPYVLGIVAVSVFNAITDPTTKGIGDSDRAMTYEAPN